jgi:transcriptional regulator GlxA family with amidase domain
VARTQTVLGAAGVDLCLHQPRRPALRRAGMSVRTFSRRFKVETGQSPGAWLLQQRLRHACRLLETTTLPVERVAGSAGLGTAASLRHHLRTGLGVSPLAFRNTFRAS